MINLLTHINANGANAEPGLCWYVFGFVPNGASTSTTPITIIVDGSTQTLNFGDRIGTHSNPSVEFINCDGVYQFLYGCNAASPPFAPCPCPGGDCSDLSSYDFDANGCCGSSCTCGASITYDQGLCQITYSSSGDCAAGSWELQYSATGGAPWSVEASGTGNISSTTITPTDNGFYRLRYAAFGDCPEIFSNVVNVSCVSMPSCVCSATLALNGCNLDLDVFGVDCVGRPWQLQYSASGTGWTSVLNNTGTVSTTYTPTQNGLYRLVVTGGSCTPIQTPNVLVSCIGINACTFGTQVDDGTQNGIVLDFASMNVGQELEWKFSCGPGSTVPDQFIIRFNGVVELDTGLITTLADCNGIDANVRTCVQNAGGIFLADFAPTTGTISLSIPTGNASVDINGYNNTCLDNVTPKQAEIVNYINTNYDVVAYGSIPITVALANKPIQIEVIANPCGSNTNFWAFKLQCI